MNYLKKNWSNIVFGIIGIGIFFGFKFYNKSQAKAEVKTQVTALCNGDDACLSAMDTHFPECFSKSYSLGGRRRAGGLNTEKFVDCFNQASGTNFLGTGGE